VRRIVEQLDRHSSEIVRAIVRRVVHRQVEVGVLSNMGRGGCCLFAFCLGGMDGAPQLFIPYDS
jgi:hypothetical protein